MFVTMCYVCCCTHDEPIKRVTTPCNTLQHHKTPTHDEPITLCKLLVMTLQHTVTHCNTLQHTATHCNTLQHSATHCNTLQHTATHCDTLQHSATRCRTLQNCIMLSSSQPPLLYFSFIRSLAPSTTHPPPPSLSLFLSNAFHAPHIRCPMSP